MIRKLLNYITTPNKGEWLFVLLSFTWGLPVSLCGLIVFAFLWFVNEIIALVSIITGKYIKPFLINNYGCSNPIRWFAHFPYVAVRGSWGGQEAGYLSFVDQDLELYIIKHEIGHSLQNTIYGPFMIFLIIIGATRFWIRKIKKALGVKLKTGYYDFWIEKQANEWGQLAVDKCK